MVAAAPIPFFIALVIAAALIWIAIGWSHSGVLSAKNVQIELQDRQLSDYRDKLKGATPEEAKASTNFKVNSFGLDEPDFPEIVFVSVDINSN
jgi:hypothetical protein